MSGFEKMLEQAKRDGLNQAILDNQKTIKEIKDYFPIVLADMCKHFYNVYGDIPPKIEIKIHLHDLRYCLPVSYASYLKNEGVRYSSKFYFPVQLIGYLKNLNIPFQHYKTETPVGSCEYVVFEWNTNTSVFSR